MMRPCDDGFGGIFDFCCHAPQESRFVSARDFGKHIKRGGGEVSRLVDILGRGGNKRRLQRLSRGGIDGMKPCSPGCGGRLANQ